MNISVLSEVKVLSYVSNVEPLHNDEENNKVITNSIYHQKNWLDTYIYLIIVMLVHLFL